MNAALASFRRLAAHARRSRQESGSYLSGWILDLGSVGLVILTFYFLGRLVDARVTLGAGGYFAYTIPGIAMAGLLVGVVRAHTAAIRSAQTAGTLEPMLLAPSASWEIAVGSALSPLMRDVLLALGYLALAALLGAQLLGTGLLWLPLVLLVSLLSFVPFGLLGATWVVVQKRGDPISYLVNSATMLLAGVYFPHSVLPGWMQRCGELFPPTYAVAALRAVTLGTQSPLDSLIPLAIFSAVALPLSAWLFDWGVDYSRRQGALGQA